MTIESGVALTLDNVTVNGTSFDDTASGATIQVDGGDTLTLYDVTINGGIINDFSADTRAASSPATSTSPAPARSATPHLNNGDVTIESGVR